MKSVKKIIGIIGDFGFFEKNKKIFEDLNLIVLKVKNEENLEKCDGIFFGTSSFFQLKIFYGDIFFDKVLNKIENNFPVFCSSQSVNFFLKKISKFDDLPMLEKKGKIGYENGLFNESIFLNFLDSKEVKIKIFKNFYYGSVNFFGMKKIIFNFKKKYYKNIKTNKINKFGEINISNNLPPVSSKNFEKKIETLFFYKKTVFTIFSPDFYGDKRIYEYFVNNFF